MITIDGLGQNIRNKMTEYHEAQAVAKILEAAGSGQTGTKVKAKGLTYDFLDKLADEGIESIKEDRTVQFIWDGVEV